MTKDVETGFNVPATGDALLAQSAGRDGLTGPDVKHSLTP
jgi:hypothetical protein